jgi:CHASE2 domain-containing sensor protein
MGWLERYRKITMDNGPFRASEFIPLAWVFVVSLIGGLASWARKVRAGITRPFNVAELIGELLISAFVGMLTYWICRWVQLNEWATAAAIGVASHMGLRALFLAEHWLQRIVQRFMRAKIGE